MPFDLKIWQQKVRDWWADQAPKLKTLPIDSAYALLAASAWLPFLAAYTDDPGTAVTALVGVTSSIGSNLVTEVIQRIYDRARDGDQIAEQARGDAQIRAELDAILEGTGALQAAQQALGDRWDTFARQLAGEIAALPGQSTLTVTLGDDTVVGGSVITGNLTLNHGSTFVGGNYIDQRTISPPSDTPALDEDKALARYLRHVIESNHSLRLQGIRSAGQLVSIDLEEMAHLEKLCLSSICTWT